MVKLVKAFYIINDDMMESMEKLVIGITGHRDLRAEDIPNLIVDLEKEINRLRDIEECKYLQMLNALASGADRLAADYALNSGIDLIAVLPFSQELYEKDFDDEDLIEFRRQLSSASQVIAMTERKDDCQSCKEDGYRDAGRYIAENCDYLIAFWDGISGTADGCGTGDIVRYFTDRKPGKLIQIETRRRDKRPLSEVKNEADIKSLQNQKVYIRCLRLLSILGFAVVCAYICYDNLGLTKMILVYAILIALGAFILFVEKKKKYHENYINYRLLAEILRVQAVLDMSGLERNAAGYLPTTLSEETEWIHKIVELGIHDNPIDDLDILKTEWLENQYGYHVSARKRTEGKLRTNKVISTIVLIITICVIVFACIIELIPSVDIDAGMGVMTLKNRVLIAVGILSAVSVFLSGYYGTQNLERKCHDHIKMADLYKNTLEKNEGKSLTLETIESIAREEILENSNWYSYMIESKLTIDF